MRFSLQDVKKSVRSNNMALHFLRPGELHTEIESLISYYERSLGRAQRQFSLDEARSCVGDYRLAHCLIATLSNWYNWQQREWHSVLDELPSCPSPGDIASPVQLRLALYTYVNERYQGFLDTQTRITALHALAESWQLSVSALEALLVLDSEEEALLTRNAPQPPAPKEVANLYNQWAFESALFNASSVHFVIDCNAFSNVQEESASVSAITIGAGMVIKRLCYLARKLGVYYDLAYDGPDILPFTQEMPARLHLILYGPQEVTGVPQQYGLRLARLCRLLLGYGIAKHARKVQRSTAAIVEAEADVHFLHRAYKFRMDAQLLQLLPTTSEPERNNDRNMSDASTLFDSSIEESFSEAFSALAESRGVDGWRLEREPEPLLFTHGIFIPDFALTRARKRIYVEILGFWTPAYRERKVQKLQQLQTRADLLLAIPIEAKDAFVSIATYFPIVYYDKQLSVTEVLQLLRTHYDDFAERLELIDLPAVRKRVLREGLVSEHLCYELLHAYRRSELQQAAGRVTDENVLFLPGIGLYSLDWLESLKRSFMVWILSVRTVALSVVLREARERWPVLTECEDGTIEALLELWPEIRVRRDSIFEAVVEVVADLETSPAEEVAVVKVAKKQVREKRVTMKKHHVVEQEVMQGDLWG